MFNSRMKALYLLFSLERGTNYKAQQMVSQVDIFYKFSDAKTIQWNLKAFTAYSGGRWEAWYEVVPVELCSANSPRAFAEGPLCP